MPELQLYNIPIIFFTEHTDLCEIRPHERSVVNMNTDLSLGGPSLSA